MIRILVPLFTCALLSGCANSVSQPIASLALVSSDEVISSSSVLNNETSSAITQASAGEVIMIAQTSYTVSRSYFSAKGTVCRHVRNTRINRKGAAKVLCKAAGSERWYWIPSILAEAEPAGESQ